MQVTFVAWIVGHDHRFKAACAQRRGVYDLATFFGEGNAWRLVPTISLRLSLGTQGKSQSFSGNPPITYVDQITHAADHLFMERTTGAPASCREKCSTEVLGVLEDPWNMSVIPALPMSLRAAGTTGSGSTRN